MNSGGSAHRPHTKAAMIAIVLTVTALTAGVLFCDRLEKENVHAVAGDFSTAKVQGAVLQRQAFASPDLLVLYGSSELGQDSPTNANKFFEEYPTGFRVFPVGKPGTTSLGTLQKVAAVGTGISGRKVAFSISPGWFFTELFDPAYYEGNFSKLQAYELAFSNTLSPELKHEIAQRMVEYPATLQDEWLLQAALQRLANDTLTDRVLYTLIWPLGRMNTAVGRAQDHLEAALHIVEQEHPGDAVSGRKSRILNWEDLLRRGAQFGRRAAVKAWKADKAKRRPQLNPDKKRIKTQAFVQTISRAKEWTDLELLLRTFRELGATPLLLSMPVENLRLDVYGVSSETRTAYRQRLHELAERYGVRLVDFHEHDQEETFLSDFSDHLSPEGWLYYSQALDDFYHDRIP